jgi:CubicO group peptidase (beta-lactamase class C family)
MGLLRLREEGRLDLDADVNDYLDFEIDNPNIEGERISVRTLASHTSSIADFLDESTYVPNADPPTPVGDFVRQLLVPGGARYDNGASYLDASPGAARVYSNLGAGVAGAVLESITGESLASYQARTLFRPLGMRHTSWRIAGYGPNELAVRYNVSTAFEPLPHYGNPNYPDGGLNASANDLAILMQAVFGDGALGSRRVLSSESMAEMFRLQAEGIDARQRFFWRDRDGLTGHMGSDAGVFTALYFDRGQRNGFIVLMNRTPDRTSEQAMGQIALRIRADFFGESPAS